jgi:hypothetical protein
MLVIYRVASKLVDSRVALSSRATYEEEDDDDNNNNNNKSMGLSTTRESIGFVASTEICTVLWNPKVHYRIHKSSHL